MKPKLLDYRRLAEYIRNKSQHHDLSRSEIKQFQLLKKSRAFDEKWYVDTYEDVRLSKIDPVCHYIKHGAKEGRRPNSWFDTFDYVENNMSSQKENDTNPFVHYLQYQSSIPVSNFDRGHLTGFSDAAVKMALERFIRFPLFSAEDYLSMNEPLRSVKDLVPHHHALVWGIPEGRNVFRKNKVAALLSQHNQLEKHLDTTEDNFQSSREPEFYESAKADINKGGDRRCDEIGVFYNTEGNTFLKEFAECVVSDLQAAGYSAALYTERAKKEEIPPRSIVVAPHEFFFIGNGTAFAKEDFVRNIVVLNTEQPQTVWFDRAVPFSLLSKGIIDISPQVSRIYRETGIPTLQIDLSGPAPGGDEPDVNNPLFRVLPRAAKLSSDVLKPLMKRPIDVSFFGAMSHHREQFFARSASFLSEYETFIYCRRFTSPLKSEGRDGDLTKLASYVARQSKITLNIHRDEYNFFEWHRIVRTGMENGSLVVSEPCLNHPIFKPGIHYLEESGRHIHNLIEWVLRSEDGMVYAEKIRAAAREVICRSRETKVAGNKIAEFINNCFG